MLTIHDKTMLINLSITKWSMRKHDKKISDEIEQKYSATEAGRYNKCLLAIECGKQISQIDTGARTFHYINTLPWSDNGARILPSKNYFEYVRKMSSIKDEREGYVRTFIQNFEVYKEESKLRLNGLYKESDYPAIYDLEDKYSFEYSITPIPSGNDFRIDIGGMEMQKIREELEEKVKISQGKAVQDLWYRLKDAIQHIVARLSDKDAVFRDSLIENIIELTQILPRLNFTDDPDLEDMRREIEQSICTVSPQNLRSDANLRKNTAKEAKALMDKMAVFM